MILQVLYENSITPSLMVGFVSSVFKVEPSQISDLEDDSESDIYYSIKKSELDRQFVLELFFDHAILVKGVPSNDLELAKLFSNYFDRSALISGESINPYEWLKVENDKVDVVFRTIT